MKIKVKKGLNIPIAGPPLGLPQPLPPPEHISLTLDEFQDIRFRLLVKTGQNVKIGEPLVENKSIPNQMFVAPAGGVIEEIRRGEKRRLLDIIIRVEKQELFHELPKTDIQKSTREELLGLFMRGGLFPHIRLRPFNLIPDPQWVPRDIFVNGVETRPFVPSYERQLLGYERDFQAGLDALTKLTTGSVHLVFSKHSDFPAFLHAENVKLHTIEGPHPAGNSSIHIHHIAPIRHAADYVWTLSALDVLVIGKMILEGRYFTPRLISIAGPGILNDKRGFFLGRMGHPISALLAHRLPNTFTRLISGDLLTGREVEPTDFLGFNHRSFCALEANDSREAFHFFRLGSHKFTATRTYASGFIAPPEGGYPFNTNQHGEERAFIDGSVYDRVMPMRIPTMHLIKAILCDDFEVAEQLGLLEVVPEDFALATFIDPSKIEMVDIVKQGLHRYSKEMGF